MLDQIESAWSVHGIRSVCYPDGASLHAIYWSVRVAFGRKPSDDSLYFNRTVVGYVAGKSRCSYDSWN
jgi:hypothetical protein